MREKLIEWASDKQLAMLQDPTPLHEALLRAAYDADVLEYSLRGAQEVLDERLAVLGKNFCMLGRVIVGDHELVSQRLLAQQKRGLYIGRAHFVEGRLPSDILLFLSDGDDDNRHEVLRGAVGRHLIRGSVERAGGERARQLLIDLAEEVASPAPKSDVDGLIQRRMTHYMLWVVLGIEASDDDVELLVELAFSVDPLVGYLTSALRPLAPPEALLGKHRKRVERAVQLVATSPAMSDYTPSDDNANLSREAFAELCLGVLVVAALVGGTNLATSLLTKFPADVVVDPDDKKALVANVLELARLHPPVNNVNVIATEPFAFTYKGEPTEVPAGTVLALSLGVACRDASVYPNPEAFDASRDNLLTQTVSFAGVGDQGHRMCPGRDTAMIMATDLLAAIQRLRHPVSHDHFVGGLSLPQADPPAQREERREALAKVREDLYYRYDSRVSPLGIANDPTPANQHFDPVQIGNIASRLVDLLGNTVDIAARLLEDPTLKDEEREVAEEVEKALDALIGHHRTLSRLTSLVHARRSKGDEASPQPKKRGLLGNVVEGIGDIVEGVIEVAHGAEELAHAKQAPVPSKKEAASTLVTEVKAVLETFVSDAVQALFKWIGLYGQAPDLHSFEEQFRLILVPSEVGAFEDDVWFARQRVAGPNPLMIEGVDTLPSGLAFTDEDYRRVVPDDTLQEALDEGRIFIADYKLLDGMSGGTVPRYPKYITAPIAVFALPRGAEELVPVGIQLGQTSDDATPLFQPDGSVAWRLAKLHVQVADGQIHEMVSHLGQTHLLVEAFAVTTPRQLSTSHPLYALLTPHTQGTIAINDLANQTLIAPNNFVDRILAGPLDQETKLAVDSVLAITFDQFSLRQRLAARNVLDADRLPFYPYRDDALLIWDALEAWVHDYLSLWYRHPADLTNDNELQAWLTELGASSDEGGAGLKGIRATTVPELVQLVTTAIFMGSVEHAAVNFPQSYVMSYTPALPLAAYAPAPTVNSPYLPEKTLLETLPPLDQAYTQLIILQLLGGVWFTRLGDYSRFRVTPYFEDARVQMALEVFQGRLAEVEREIALRNQHRPPYRTLLPSQIPQSINI